jgi:hypothetical protein
MLHLIAAFSELFQLLRCEDLLFISPLLQPAMNPPQSSFAFFMELPQHALATFAAFVEASGHKLAALHNGGAEVPHVEGDYTFTQYYVRVDILVLMCLVKELT